MSFDPEYAGEQPVAKAAPSYPEFRNRRQGHLKLAGTPIDVAFGQIDVLWKLDKQTLEGMAVDPATPVVVLERLAVHPNADVRAAVAENENTPLYTVWALAKDADADVRYQLAENHNLPLALLRSMTNDENPYVACRAQKTYDRLQSR
jgi:hypothetical protein